MTTRVLLVGESWTTSETHYKGFDQFGSVRFHTGATPLLEAMKDSDFQIDYMTAHDAAEGFPFAMEGLAPYDIIILSDIGANTFLLPPDVWLRSRTVPNRLRLLKEWVAQGGNLLQAGLSARERGERARHLRNPSRAVERGVDIARHLRACHVAQVRSAPVHAFEVADVAQVIVDLVREIGDQHAEQPQALELFTAALRRRPRGGGFVRSRTRAGRGRALDGA